MTPSPLLSICIPSWNGGSFIAETLESMISQVQGGLEDKIEIVICDDASTDNTPQKALEFAALHSYVHVFQNPKNLGMDGNFRQTALHAKGKFVWYSGQDDVFCDGIVQKVVTTLESRPELGFVYVNYSQLDHDLKNTLVRSYFAEEALDPARVIEGQDLYLRTPSEFFSVFPAAPSFLPATVMRRSFWLDTDVSAYEGTAFIQTALILLNLCRAPLLAITTPSILGRIPNDRWQTEGQAYFKVLLGSMVVEARVFNDPRNPIPASLYHSRKRLFLRNFFALTRHARSIGMKPTPRHMSDLTLIYGRGLIYWFILVPCMRAPLWVMNLARTFKRRVYFPFR